LTGESWTGLLDRREPAEDSMELLDRRELDRRELDGREVDRRRDLDRR